MAPMTRRAQNAVLNRSPLRFSHTREESWEHVDSRSNGSLAPESPLFLTSGRTNDTLNPLRVMVDRVSNDVELFAEKVDLWYQTSREADGLEEGDVVRFRNTIILVDELQNITNHTVVKLKKQLPREQEQDLGSTLRKRVRSLNRDGSSASPSENDGESLDDDASLKALRQADMEAGTWELFKIMLNLDHSNPGLDVEKHTQEYLSNRGGTNRYTPESELWTQFLLETKSARERHLILRWLEATARNREKDMSKIMTHLEAAAGAEKGTWSHGWLGTREKLKGAKRIRLMEGPLPADMPNLKTSDRSELLVTQLDPDAMTRQRRALETEDEKYERSIWLTCFEMLRRGIPWENVRDWCDEHKESWRAVSFGMAYANQESRTCLGGANSGALWRRMCFATARHGANDIYERAVYGLLAGDTESVEPACRTWDDFLYTNYNSLLLSQFEKYLQDNFPDRVSAVSRKLPVFDAVQAHGDLETAGSRVIENLRKRKATSAEANQSMKLIQGSLIGRNFHELVFKLGIAFSKKANANGVQSKLIPETHHAVDDSIMAIANDTDALRMIIHILLVFQIVNPAYTSGFDSTIMENVIVSYIDFLRMSGKIESIPTYGVLLSAERQYVVLGKILLDISDHQEQKTLVELMQKNGINVIKVLSEQYLYAVESNSFDEAPYKKPFKFLEPTDESKYPGQSIRADFAPEDITGDDEKIIRSIEWFLYVDSNWWETLNAMQYGLRFLLLLGRFGAALEFTNRMPFKTVSMQKSTAFMGKAMDVMEEELEEDDADMRRSTRSGRKNSAPTVHPDVHKSKQHQLDIMRAQGRQCYELQQLVHALFMLSEWRKLEVEYLESTEFNNRIMRPATRDAFRDALNGVQTSMEPLCHDFLTNLYDERTAEEYQSIRQNYLPECLIAYTAVLCSAGTYISRDNLLRALELSTVVASEVDPALATALLETGRMKEFVTAMALCSKRLLRLNHEDSMREEEGREGAGMGMGKTVKKSKKRKGLKKRTWNGSVLEVWEPGKMN